MQKFKHIITFSFSASLSLLVLVVFCAVILGLSLRGIPGNPTHEALNNPEWKDNGPLELSPDRGRFALTYSLIEDHSLTFALPVAQFTTPDLAVTSDGKYVSLFAPGLSFLTMPGYIAGRALGAAQVGTFAVIALFGILNVLLIRAIAIRLGASPLAASLGALVFLFASPAFTYAVTLYQHHISVFLILLSIYVLLRWNTLWSLAVIWLLCAASVVVDNPNFFLMFPIGVFALGKMMWIERKEEGTARKRFLVIRPLSLFTIFAMALPIALFLWFNMASNGSPFTLSGTLTSVKAIDAAGHPADSPLDQPIIGPQPVKEKSALGFFRTRNLLNGFYIHLLSPDRGMLVYTPVMFFGILGLAGLFRRNPKAANLLIAVIGVNILLYSMWGDPWGGWAFGSRYLIPSYALLGIGIALMLTYWRKKYILLIAFLAVLGYSVWVNALGAITSSRNPPQIEVLTLESITNQQEKYSWDRNLQFLNTEGSKSFVFQEFADRYVSAPAYLGLIISLIMSAMVGMILRDQLIRRSKSLYEKSYA